MPTLLNALITRLKSRAFRRGVVSLLFRPMIRAADTVLLGPGELVASSVHRILVLRPNHRLGNLLLLTPLIAEIGRLFPGAEVDVLTGSDAAREILTNFFSVRRVHIFPHFVARHLLQALGMIVALRRAHYDLVIDPTQDSHSNRLLIGWMRPRAALGYPSPTSFRQGGWAPLSFLAPRHSAKLPIFLLRHSLAVRSAVDEDHFPPLDIRLTRSERRAGQAALKALLPWQGPTRQPVTIGIFTNATGLKRFDKQWWLSVLGPLIAAHPEYTLVEFVAADGLSRLDNRFATYYSSSPRKLASVISSLTLFVSADCGVMHLASASRAPTLGLFSVTDLEVYGPYSGHNLAVRTNGKAPEQIALALSQALESVKCDRFQDRDAIRIPLKHEFRTRIIDPARSSSRSIRVARVEEDRADGMSTQSTQAPA